MEEQVLQTIARHKMLRQGDTVAVGVSGGADSVALLCFLYENRARWNLTLRVCHLNHSLRGEESLRDQRFVEDLARDLDLEFCLAVGDAAGEARLRGLSVEEAARELRYDFFRACAGPDGKIATAHTRSDSMETLLLNLTRGTGVRGLRGIPPVRDKIIRPLSDVTRQECRWRCWTTAGAGAFPMSTIPPTTPWTIPATACATRCCRCWAGLTPACPAPWPG